jgi:hypothetical protein
MAKAKAEKPKEPQEVVTDILEEYFWDEQAHHEMVRRKHMNGDKLVKETVERHV